MCAIKTFFWAPSKMVEVLHGYFRKARSNHKEALCLIMALVWIVQENGNPKYLLKVE